MFIQQPCLVLSSHITVWAPLACATQYHRPETQTACLSSSAMLFWTACVSSPQIVCLFKAVGSHGDILVLLVGALSFLENLGRLRVAGCLCVCLLAVSHLHPRTPCLAVAHVSLPKTHQSLLCFVTVLALFDTVTPQCDRQSVCSCSVLVLSICVLEKLQQHLGSSGVIVQCCVNLHVPAINDQLLAMCVSTRTSHLAWTCGAVTS